MSQDNKQMQVYRARVVSFTNVCLRLAAFNPNKILDKDI